MSDNISITAGTGTVVSTEEATTLNGATVTAQQVQRVITATRTADGTVIDGEAMATRLDAVNDAVTTYPFGHSATNISTGTTTTPITTVVKSGSGVLRGVVTGDIGSSWQATLYDNTAASGTIISVLKPTNAGFIGFEVGFTTGLTIATTGTAAGNLTVIWR